MRETVEEFDRYYRVLHVKEERSVDPVTFEVVLHRVSAIANEMGATVHRTAHSVVFAEAKDFSCALFDHHGHMVGMGEFLPGHQGGMQSTLDGLIDVVGLNAFHDGDVFLANDVHYGATHPPDLHVFMPIYASGEFIGVSGVIVHHQDMGGMSPSSYAAKSTELFQEGIRFPPPTRLYEKGTLREDILNLFLTNVRTPDVQYGDLMAQLAGCHVGARRVREMVAKYGGVKELKETFEAIQEYSADLVSEFARSLPDREFISEDYVDGDGTTENSYRIHCKLNTEGQKLVFDFSESDDQAVGNANSPLSTTSANVYTAVMSYVKHAPKNFGACVPVEIITRKGSIVNPHRDAAIGSCTTEAGHIVYNVAAMCLGEAVPEQATAIWGGSLGVHIVWGQDPIRGKRYVLELLSALGAGGGARASKDGWPVGNAKAPTVTLPNIEIEEATLPIRYRYRRVARPTHFDRAGAGKFRGGGGCEYEVEPVGHEMNSTLIVGKWRHLPQGMFGGEEGHGPVAEVRDAETGEMLRELPIKHQAEVIREGESVRIAAPGGGGFGPPSERAPEDVLADVLDGQFDIGMALEKYKVVIGGDPPVIDYSATEAARAQEAKAQEVPYTLPPLSG